MSVVATSATPPSSEPSPKSIMLITGVRPSVICTNPSVRILMLTIVARIWVANWSCPTGETRRTWLLGVGNDRWAASATFRPTPPTLSRITPLAVVFKTLPALLVSAFAMISTAAIPITASLADGRSSEVRMGACKKHCYRMIPGKQYTYVQ